MFAVVNVVKPNFIFLSFYRSCNATKSIKVKKCPFIVAIGDEMVQLELTRYLANFLYLDVHNSLSQVGICEYFFVRWTFGRKIELISVFLMKLGKFSLR